MNSDRIMYALLVFYAAILLAALWERNYWRALYFLGAIVISIAVLGMTDKVPTAPDRAERACGAPGRNE